MELNFCIHGHFYQPFRADPWTERIGVQESAHPHRNWNERITDECYSPNTAAYFRDRQGRERTINNFENINFDVGPTLMLWLKRRRPEVYRAIIQADRDGVKRFNGHGPAIALASYHHVILPLANRKDKVTQVIWSIEDFLFHYGRLPEGMWLPEAAVDIESLDVMAERGIKFTVLSQYQAARYREIGSNEWHDAGHGSINTRRPYLCRLPSGRSIAIFFYDGHISQKAAYGDMLSSGSNLAHALHCAVGSETGPQIVHMALDGETFGHHKKFAEMAIPYCIDHIRNENLGRITVYGEFLENNPPTCEVEIRAGAWSCAHSDFGRWHRDCGCKVDPGRNWNQGWRTPLRQSLEWLNEKLDGIYLEEGSRFLKDPVAARNDYIKVILDQKNTDHFFRVNARRQLAESEKRTVKEFLRLQSAGMLMFTSCGWFFDDLTNIETVQNIKQAKWAIKQARRLFAQDLEPGFLNILGQAFGNIHGVNGHTIYENCGNSYSIF